MKTLILAILFRATLFSVVAQQFDKKALDEKVNQIDTSFKFRHTMYVINGIPFSYTDTTKIDSTLNAYGLKYLISIDILKEAARNLINSNNDVVLVTFAYNQKFKKKKELLKKVKRRFTDKYVSFSQHIFTDAKDPVLYIDNKLIHHTEATQRINALTIKKVYYIDYNDKAVSSEHYGQNAKNGLIRIWTVPK